MEFSQVVVFHGAALFIVILALFRRSLERMT